VLSHLLLLALCAFRKRMGNMDFKAATKISGTSQEQEKVEEEASDTAMPMASNAHMTFVKEAMAEQTTKLPKPHQ
jgi:hypothetical protein